MSPQSIDRAAIFAGWTAQCERNEQRIGRAGRALNVRGRRWLVLYSPQR